VLVTPENDWETGAGRLGLWSRRENYRRIGEIASGGTGPHDILRLDGDVLAVANGGIRTRPDQGRDKLNIETMQPSLAYVDTDLGLLDLVELEPDLHKNSIRHLAERNGTVAFAMQWQGELPDPVPLLGLHRRGEAPVLCTADLAEQIAMEGYAGSVAISPEGRVGITSPRGARLHVFDLEGNFAASYQQPDICGLAAGTNGFFATDGLGHVLSEDAGTLSLCARSDRAWDNHLVRIAA